MLQAIHRGPELRVMPTREGGRAAPRLAAPLSRRYLGGDRPVAVFCMNLVTTTSPPPHSPTYYNRKPRRFFVFSERCISVARTCIPF